MKHYIVTYQGRLWLVFAKNPPEAIKKVIAKFNIKGKWNDFTAATVKKITEEVGEVVEFQVADAE